MSRITLDATMRQKLLDLRQPLELCDESGRVVARLTPVPYEPQLSEAELLRREQEPDFSTAELLARLEKL